MAIALQVNGRAIEASKGETILSALNRHGMHVPTICSMKDLSPSGACRMCVVEVDGRENLVPACSFPIEGPMDILTHSPRVLRARKTNVELLLSNPVGNISIAAHTNSLDFPVVDPIQATAPGMDDVTDGAVVLLRGSGRPEVPS